MIYGEYARQVDCSAHIQFIEGNTRVRIVRQVRNEPGAGLGARPACGMDKLIELMNSSLVSGAVITVLTSWLTSRARNRQEQQAEIGALGCRLTG
ncbi:hypothetical protein [Streptomyces sp. NPDC000994]